MTDEQNIEHKKRKSWWTFILTFITLILIIFLAWVIFIKPDEQSSNQNPSSSSSTPVSSVNDLISYSLPAGWNTLSCNNPNEIILIVPDGKVTPTCSTLADSWPTKLLIDPKNTRDCNQIKVNNQQITSHTCSSKIINGTKVLVSNTSYNDKSSYGKNTNATDYYVITNKGVANLHYADDVSSPDDDYQTEFDQIANSIKAK
jgi:hypothetical protein